MAIDARKTKAEVAYQTSPKGARSRCDLCLSFVHPDTCKAVKGPISERGWCNIGQFAQKPMRKTS